MYPYPLPTTIKSFTKIHLPIDPSIHPSTNSFPHPFIHLHSSTYLHTFLPFHSTPHVTINSHLFTSPPTIHFSSTHSPIHLPTTPFTYLPIHWPFHPFIRRSICLPQYSPIHTFSHLFIHQSAHTPTHPPMHSSIHPLNRHLQSSVVLFSDF